MWLLTIEDYEGLTTYHRLSRERYRLGRSPDNDFVLAQLNVSRHHARLERSGALWLYRDEGSLLGSYVNCGLVFAHEPVPLDDGAVVQFGDYVLRLSREAPDGSLTPTPRYVAPARVRALSGPLAGVEHVFGRDQVVSVGRSDDCTLRIVHPDISMVHALIRPLPGGRHELVDRSDDGRLFINGRKLVADRVLEGGDSIDVGGVVIFRYLEASQQSDPSFDECWGEPVKASLARLRVRPLVADEGAASASRVNVAAAAVRAEEVLQAAGAASLAEAASPSRGNEAASARGNEAAPSRSDGAASARGNEAAPSRSDGAASARGGEAASARADGEASLRADAAGGPRGGGAALLRADAAGGPRGGGAAPGVRAGIVTSALRLPSTRPPPSEGSSGKGVPMLLDERVEAAGPVSLPSPKPASASYQRLRLATIGLGPDSQGRQRGVVLGRELEGPRVDADGARPRGASAWPLATSSPEVEASLEGRMARGDDALAAGPPEPPAEHWYRRYRAFRAAEAMLVVAAAFGAMLGLRRALPAHEMKPEFAGLQAAGPARPLPSGKVERAAPGAPKAPAAEAPPASAPSAPARSIIIEEEAPRAAKAPAGAAAPPPAAGAERGAPAERASSGAERRARLEARAKSGQAGEGELRELLGLCQAAGDARCVGDASLLLQKTQRAP